MIEKKYQSETMTAKDLVERLNFKPAQAKAIIHLAKETMVKRGFTIYNNRRMGVVPTEVVAEIVGIPLLQTKEKKE